MKDHWGWRQTLSWKVGFRRARSSPQVMRMLERLNPFEASESV